MQTGYHDDVNLGQLRTAVRLRANVPANDGIWTNAFVNDAINTALADLSLEQPWWWLQNTATPTATDGAVTLSGLSPVPRDISHVFVGDVEAKKVSVAESDLTAVSGPVDARYTWSVWGQSLQIRPEPSASETITMRYYRDEPVLTADSDTPIMPAAYHPVIVERACAIGFESLDDQSSAAMHEARSRSFLSHMIATALRRIRGRHSIRVRAGHPY